MAGADQVITLTPSSTALVPGWSAESYRRALEAAAESWSFPAIECTSVKLVVGPARPIWRVREDGLNLVAFRRGDWCHNERCGPTSTFPTRAMAMTTAYPEGASGSRVREGDIEINAVSFRFSQGERGGDGPGSWTVPLQAVLVHEIGHVLGLEDVCHAGHGRFTAKGGECSAAEREQAMYAPALLMRPTALDARALCALRPREEAPVAGGARPAESRQTERCGCQAPGVEPGILWLSAVAAVWSLWWLRRWSRRGRRGGGGSLAT